MVGFTHLVDLVPGTTNRSTPNEFQVLTSLLIVCIYSQRKWQTHTAQKGKVECNSRRTIKV